MTKKHYHHHMEEATGEPVESYKVVCERCRKVLGDVPDCSLRGLKFVMCKDCFGVGEPTIIEIGEPYPEELDLDEFNRLTRRVAKAALAYSFARRKEVPLPKTMSTQTQVEYEEKREDSLRHWRALLVALDEYEKMRGGE